MTSRGAEVRTEVLVETTRRGIMREISDGMALLERLPVPGDAETGLIGPDGTPYRWRQVLTALEASAFELLAPGAERAALERLQARIAADEVFKLPAATPERSTP